MTAFFGAFALTHSNIRIAVPVQVRKMVELKEALLVVDTERRAWPVSVAVPKVRAGVDTRGKCRGCVVATVVAHHGATECRVACACTFVSHSAARELRLLLNLRHFATMYAHQAQVGDAKGEPC